MWQTRRHSGGAITHTPPRRSVTDPQVLYDLCQLGFRKTPNATKLNDLYLNVLCSRSISTSLQSNSTNNSWFHTAFKALDWVLGERKKLIRHGPCLQGTHDLVRKTEPSIHHAFIQLTFIEYLLYISYRWTCWGFRNGQTQLSPQSRAWDKHNTQQVLRSVARPKARYVHLQLQEKGVGCQEWHGKGHLYN